MSKNKDTLLLASLAALFLAGCGGASDEAAEPTAAAPEVAPADLVLRGGTVATVDPALGNVEAIAVNGYRITAVGSNEEISA
jgi:ABC-type Fe3+-hydroxamate transport system substrate-binding protein